MSGNRTRRRLLGRDEGCLNLPRAHDGETEDDSGIFVLLAAAKFNVPCVLAVECNELRRFATLAERGKSASRNEILSGRSTCISVDVARCRLDSCKGILPFAG